MTGYDKYYFVIDDVIFTPSEPNKTHYITHEGAKIEEDVLEKADSVDSIFTQFESKKISFEYPSAFDFRGIKDNPRDVSQDVG